MTITLLRSRLSIHGESRNLVIPLVSHRHQYHLKLTCSVSLFCFCLLQMNMLFVLSHILLQQYGVHIPHCFFCFSSVIASNLLLVDEIMRAGMSSLKG